METPSKPIFTSKTAAVQAVVAVAAFVPAARDFVAQHPAEVLLGLAVVNLAVRLITKGRVTLFGKE
jgi:hypothetical protein